jgi:hypothetical protein
MHKGDIFRQTVNLRVGLPFVTIRNSMTTTQEQLKVVLLGMDVRSQRLLKKLFDGPLQGHCSVIIDGTADFAIIDMDSRGAHELWLAFKKKMDIPAIVFSLSETHFPDSICVLKPLQVLELKGALKNIRSYVGRRKQRIEKRALVDRNKKVKQEVLTHLSKQPIKETFQAAELSYDDQEVAGYCGDIEDKWYLQEKLPDKLFYAPELHLQGILDSAIKEVRKTNRPVLLRGLGRDIIVFIGGRYIHTKMPIQQVRAICNITFDERYIEFLFKRNQSFNPSSLLRQATKSEGLLWDVTLWTSKGRLPYGTDIDMPIGLSAWPNLTRLTRTPHALQLAALWYRQTISLRATIILLNISPRYIYTFYSACHQQGLIRHYSHAEARSAARVEKSKKGVLSRLMTFLRRN